MAFFQYLKNTEISKNEKNGFIAKSPIQVTEDTDQLHNSKLDQPSLLALFPQVETGYDYKNFLHDLKIEIEKKDHVYSEHIGIVIIIFFNFLREKELKLTPERLWHQLLNTYFTTCNVQLEYPMNIRLDNTFSPLKLETIEIKKLNGDDLKEKIEKHTLSDFFKRHLAKEKHLNELMSFSQPERPIIIFNITKVLTKINVTTNNPVIHSLLNSYFENVALSLFEDFWRDFEAEQTISVALGAPYYDPMVYREYALGEGQQLAIFTHIAKHPQNGWVSSIKPVIGTLHYDSLKPNHQVSKDVELHNSAINELTEFSHILNQLIKFMAIGNKYLYQNNINDAFLSLWVALDTILNDDDENARSNLLKNRVAALIWHKNKTKHSTEYFKVSELYKLRSGYVHAGEEVSRSDALTMNEICLAIYNIILKMHKNAVEFADITLPDWYHAIDELADIGRKTQNVNEELLEDVGLIDMK